MPSLNNFLLRFTGRFELYHNIVSVPLAIYFISIAGNLNREKVIYFLISAVISASIAMIIGTVIRIVRLKSILGPLEDKNADFRIIKQQIVAYPKSEAIVGALRWISGLALCYIILLQFTELSTMESIPFLLNAFMVIPVATVIEYFTTENALAVYNNLDQIKSASLKPGSYKPFNVHARTIVIVISILLIPLIIFGYLFYLSNKGFIQVNNMVVHILFVSLLSLLAIFVAVYESTGGTRKSLSIAIDTLENLAKGFYDVDTIPMLTSAEMGAISQNINIVAKSLREYKEQNDILTNNLEEKVEERTIELKAAFEEIEATNQILLDTRNELWGEMELAKKIQTVLLPRNPKLPNYEISASMFPADSVGGDYYDVISVNDSDWVIIGDVSGHGIPAGLVMMMVQTSIHTILRENPKIKPKTLLKVVNRSIAYNVQLMNEDKYMTITAFSINKNGKIIFSGLHQDIIVYRAKTDDVELIETNGIWLGFDIDLGRSNENEYLKLETGDTMLLFTDGITEARLKESTNNNIDPVMDMFGDDRLIESFKKLGKNSTDDIRTGILKELNNYDCHDDVTIVVMRKVS